MTTTCHDCQNPYRLKDFVKDLKQAFAVLFCVHHKQPIGKYRSTWFCHKCQSTGWLGD